MKKENCTNCKHLAWEDGDTNDVCGYTCHKRHTIDLTEKQEVDLLDKLDNKKYRAKVKVCCELKAS